MLFQSGKLGGWRGGSSSPIDSDPEDGPQSFGYDVADGGASEYPGIHCVHRNRAPAGFTKVKMPHVTGEKRK